MPVGENSSKFGVFVGRKRELAELRAALDEGREGRGRLFLISGEPGIGKTRLAEEVARAAAARGMPAVWGRCWEGAGAPAYWPWIQIVRALLSASSSDARHPALPLASVHAVAQIVPEVLPGHSAAELASKEQLHPEEARFRLFDAISNLLKAGAHIRPMLVVLDDLHDADDASLAMLQFVARELRGAAILLIATYRDMEVRRSPSLTRHIGELSREARLTPLNDLSLEEVKKLVASIVGRAPDDALVVKLWKATNGNPLFIEGIVRNLMANGSLALAEAIDWPLKVPSGVREAIRMRLNSLSPASHVILAAAAAIGNEFEFNLCQRVAEVSVEAAR